MKAIILAAGQGSRLRPLTDTIPKCLVSYQGRPIIDWTTECLHRSGIHEIVIVAGYCAEQLLGRGTRLVVNPDFDNTNMVHSLFCAEEELTGEVLISYGDIVYRPDVVETLVRSPHPLSVVIDKEWRQLWEQRMPDPLADAESLKLNPDGSIRELGKTPSCYDDIEGQYMGLIKWSAAACGEIRKFYKSLDRTSLYDGKSFQQMYMTSFLQLIIQRLMPVQSVPIHGGWVEIDCPTDLQCHMI